jgi:hypothetical protein
MTLKPRNRIKGHRKVRFGDLVPHELNPRTHSEAQRAVLAELYEEIGFARSLLAYELPDGRLKLIDGHLRRDLTPDAVLDVEVLDVSDAEARTLLLTLDPLAELAGYDQEVLEKLRQAADQDSAALGALRQALAEEDAAARKRSRPPQDEEAYQEQFLVVIICEDEDQQKELLGRFREEGLNCQAKIA